LELLWVAAQVRARDSARGRRWQERGHAAPDKVAETGCLVAIGYPKFGGGLGGYARYIAICPPDWKYGVGVGEVAEAPLPKSDKVLHYDETAGMRIRE